MRPLLEIGLSNAAAATVLAAVVGVIAGSCRRAPLVRWLWLLVLLKLVTPPVVEIPVAEMIGTTRPSHVGWVAGYGNLGVLVADSAGGESLKTPLVASSGRSGVDYAAVLPLLLTAVWLAGSVVWFAVAAVRIREFNRLVRNAHVAPEWLSGEVCRLAAKLGLRRSPEVLIAAVCTGPLVWAMRIRPTMLLPAGLLDRLTAPERATLLAHELAHLRRGDHWARWLELWVLGLYWWHPVVWYARRKLREAEEECCDAWVVWAFPNQARTYAQALIRAIDFVSEARPARPVGATGLSQVPLLKRRFEMILHHGLCRRASWTTRLVMLAVTALVLSLSPVARSAAERCEEESTAQGEPAECVAPTSVSADSQVATRTRNKKEFQAVQAYTICCRMIDQAKDGSKKVLSAPEMMMLEDCPGFLRIGHEIPLEVGENTTVRLVEGITMKTGVRGDGKDRVILLISVALSKASQANDQTRNRIVTKRVYETACSVCLGEKLTLLFGEKPDILLGENIAIPQDRITGGPEADYVELVVEKGPVEYETASEAKLRAARSPFVAARDLKSTERPNPQPPPAAAIRAE